MGAVEKAGQGWVRHRRGFKGLEFGSGGEVHLSPGPRGWTDEARSSGSEALRLERRVSALGFGLLGQMVEDFADDGRIEDERENSHLLTTFGVLRSILLPFTNRRLKETRLIVVTR